MALLNIQKIAGINGVTSITIGAGSTGRILVAMFTQERSPIDVSNCSINGVLGTVAEVSSAAADIAGIVYWLDSALPATGTYSVSVNGSTTVSTVHLFYAENAPQLAPTISSILVENPAADVVINLAGAGADYVKVASFVGAGTTQSAIDVSHTNLVNDDRFGVVNEGSAESVGYTSNVAAVVGAAVAFTTVAAVIPTLTLPTQDSVTHNSATVGVTTNQVNGTLYAVVSALQPSAAQIKLGQDSTGVAAPSANKAVTSTDEAITIAGLTASTTYTVWMLQSNTAGDSNFVSTPVTTVATPKSATVVGITGGASLTGLDYAVFAGQDISTMTLLTQGAGASTNPSGDLVIDLTGVAGNNGDPLLILLGDWTTTVAGTNKAAVCYTNMSVG